MADDPVTGPTVIECAGCGTAIDPDDGIISVREAAEGTGVERYHPECHD